MNERARYIRQTIRNRLIQVGLAGVEMVDYMLRPEFKRLLDVVDAIPEDFTPPHIMNVRDEETNVLSTTGLYWDVPEFYMDIEFTSGSLSVYARDRTGDGRSDFYDEMQFLTTAWFNKHAGQLRVGV